MRTLCLSPRRGDRRPAGAGPANRYLNPRDVEAARQHSEVVAEFGGAETGPRAAYVEGVGRRIAAYSGTANAGQVYHFTTLNSAVENAFAVPGGYVYITRQLMGIMNDESELAFVVGHETDTSPPNAQGTPGSEQHCNPGVWADPRLWHNALADSFPRARSNFQAEAELHLRPEYQADVLGIRYMTSAGYDPAEAPRCWRN
jgi:predicted Zn-dependent protease